MTRPDRIQAPQRYAACLLTAGAVTVIPALLTMLVGWPLPSAMPTGSQVTDWVTDPLSSGAVVDMLAVVAWVAWAHFVTCLVVEVVNATARRGRPALQVPLGGLSQASARWLVAALLTAGATAPLAVTPAAAAPRQVLQAVAVPARHDTAGATAGHPDAAEPLTRDVAPTPADGAASSAQGATDTAPSETLGVTEEPLRAYTVAAPRAGYHDNLWDIAERHLGNGLRWTQIYQLNAGVPQPDGGALSDPDLIRPGWRLRMPADATGLPAWPEQGAAVAPGEEVSGPAAHVVQPGDTLWDIAEEHLGDGARYGELAQAAADAPQPDGGRLVDPDVIRPGWVIPLPVSEQTAPPAAGDRPQPPSGEPAKPGVPSPRAIDGDIADGSGAQAGPRGESGAGRATREPSTPGVNGDATTADVGQDETTPAAPWMLAGLTGAGAVLAGCMLLLLRQRRRGQARARRPGRTIAVPAPILAPVEKTLTMAGSASAATVELVDALLRRLAAARTRDGEPMPRLAAVELAPPGLVLHLSEPRDLPPPWHGGDDRTRWTCPRDADLDQVGPQVPDQPAPYPLLVTVGAGDRDATWLLNLEELAAVTITGDPDRGRDLARYLAAELACNPWSRHARVDCVGVAEEIAAMNPNRVRAHPGGDDHLVAEVLAEAVATADRAAEAGADVPTARAAQAEDEVWPARLLLMDAGGQDIAAVTQLRRLLLDQPLRTGTALVVSTGNCGEERDEALGVVLHVGGDGRLTLPHAGLDLAAASLTSDEAAGCATLLAQAEDPQDVEIPADANATERWRSYADAAGGLRPEHAVPRGTPVEDTDEPVESVLDAADEDYLDGAATTPEDLAALAPRVPAGVRSRVEDADPTLDADVATWFADHADLPRLTLLGPVGVRAGGIPVAKRKPYYTELLAYLATRPHGATPEEVADAMGITVPRARNDVKILRDWLGINPRTGTKHLPEATRSPAARARGVGVYQVEHVLVDLDLFRRLRLRGTSRGPEGMADLRRALTLVTGQPFDKLRPGGWAWLFEGDRLDQHAVCAVVDVAHLVTTHALHAGDVAGARAATELAALAAPHEEIPRLDLAAVAAAEGHREEARRILHDDVCNRSDDGEPPTELPERTRRILDRHDWLEADQAAS